MFYCVFDNRLRLIKTLTKLVNNRVAISKSLTEILEGKRFLPPLEDWCLQFYEDQVVLSMYKSTKGLTRVTADKFVKIITEEHGKKQ